MSSSDLRLVLFDPDKPRAITTPSDRETLFLAREGDDFDADWPALGIFISVTQLRETSDGLHGELSIDSEAAGHLHWGRLNLASTSARETIARRLQKIHPAVSDWGVLLEYLCLEVAKAHRAGEPVVKLTPSPAHAPRDLVDRFGPPVGETGLVFADGDSLKSFLGLSLCVAVATGKDLPAGFRPLTTGPALYLDWESTREEHEDRLGLLLRGLGLDGVGKGIHYRRMNRSLADDAPRLRAEISRLGAVLVVIDSLAPACGAEPEGADAVIRTLNAARSLAPATRVALAHVSKAAAEQRSGATKPWGSVFAWNLARSVWEIRRAEDDDPRSAVIGLFHRKSNRGRRQAPIGLRFEFSDDAVRLFSNDVAERHDLFARTSLSYRLQRLLTSGQHTAPQLAEETEADEATVGRTLRRLRKEGKVVDFPNDRGPLLWGLKAQP